MDRRRRRPSAAYASSMLRSEDGGTHGLWRGMVCRSAPAAAPRATALAACLTISSGDCGTRGSRVVAASDTIFGDCETRLETGGRRVVAQSASAAGQSPTSIPRAEHRISAPTQRGEGVLRNNGPATSSIRGTILHRNPRRVPPLTLLACAYAFSALVGEAAAVAQRRGIARGVVEREATLEA